MKNTILTIILAFCGGYANAQLKVNEFICYQKNDKSYSDYYYKEIVIESGGLLNKKTGTLNYSKDSDYILIWFDYGEVAIVKLEYPIVEGFSRIMMRDDIITEQDFKSYCLFHQTFYGIDRQKKRWKICTSPKEYPSLCN